MVRRTPLVLLALVLALAGCAPSPESTPTQTEFEAPAPSATPSLKPTDSATPSEPEAADFTAEGLIDLCAAKVRAEYKPEATQFTDQGTTEWLDAVSSWFVVIPNERDGVEGFSTCGIRGDQSNPVFELYGEGLESQTARKDLLAINDEGVG